MDPNDEKFWSAIPMNIVRTLRDIGHDVITLGPLDPQVPLWSRIKGRFYRHFLGKIYLLNRDPWVASLRARHGNDLIKQSAPLDAAIAVYPPDASYLEVDVPLIIVHDATWNLLLDFYPGYEQRRLAAETIEGGHALEGLALSRCSSVIYASRWAANSAMAHYRADPAKVSVFPLGAGLLRPPSREELSEFLGRRGRAPCRLLFIGLDWKRKGGDKLLAIALKLIELGLPVELDIVGALPPMRLPDFVKVHGFLSKEVKEHHETLQSLLSNADFFVLPSIAECQGMVFNEAAAYGLPVFATDVGGIPEVVRNGVWGTLFPPSASASSFARAIKAAYEDRGRYRRMAWQARDDFDDRLSWRAFCGHLLEVIDAAKGSARVGHSLGTGVDARG